MYRLNRVVSGRQFGSDTEAEPPLKKTTVVSSSTIVQRGSAFPNESLPSPLGRGHLETSAGLDRVTRRWDAHGELHAGRAIVGASPGGL